MTIRLIINIYGKVQGVGFRDAARQKAKKLNLAGRVRNEPDGSVTIEVEGKKDSLYKFLDWCKKGPLFAKVEKVSSEETEPKNDNDFSIEC